MESGLFTRVADLIIENSEEGIPEKDDIIASAIVKAVDCFSKINKIVLLSRYKELTDSKVTDVGNEISKLLFYGAQLVFVLSQDLELFQESEIDAEVETIPDSVQQDVILASMFGITSLCDLASSIYVESDLESVISEKAGISKEPVISLASDEEDIEVTDVSILLLGVFASCKMICSRLELSFENLVYNAKLIEK